ncbi:MAG: transketolase [Alphaproteobacteria bacterium]
MSPDTAGDRPSTANPKYTDTDLQRLEALERRVHWLSTWTIHNANHLRPNPDGVKVGGHQASCASISTILTALYFHELTPDDRIAVKPHGSPVMHAIQYLFGNQSREKLESFRALGGAQSYPSRTKDNETVDFSTGSVGLGAAVTSFAALTQDYLRMKGIMASDRPPGRMIAVVGDAELDEGNIYECLMESWKHDIRNAWWIIDYNRQSLDGMVSEHLFRLIGRLFRATGWNVITVKYGRKQMDAFKKPGGGSLKKWINSCPNDVYSALAFQGGAAFRRQILADMPGDDDLEHLLETYDDEALGDLMMNLGGHSMEAVLDAFSQVKDDRPTCFIFYTIKGHGLPLQGHKDNHAGLMNPEQMEGYQARMGVRPGHEWDRFEAAPLPEADLKETIENAPYAARKTFRRQDQRIPVPDTLPMPKTERTSTQEAFGRILNEIAKQGGLLADRIVTTSPDVTVSTNLGPWVNQRGLFSRTDRSDEFRDRKVPSAQKWIRSPKGQHIELGIAENNLFLTLAALGLSNDLFGARLLPIGTLYDPFISRGLDALNYACYMDSRFMVVATPSGITLAPEGGAHQSIATPLIGMSQPGLLSYEPAFADELAEIMRFGLNYLQDEDGGSIYLRLSTRPLDQPDRELDDDTRRQICSGGYWVVPPKDGASLAVVYMGAVARQAIDAHANLLKKYPGAGLLAVTSADRLYNDWQRLERSRLDGSDDGSMAHVEDLFEPLADDARFCTVLDGHPAALAWMGAVRGHAVAPLGVESFGQTGSLTDLYKTYRIDRESIEKAASRFER